MVEPTPADPDVQLEELCRVLNQYEVSYGPALPRRLNRRGPAHPVGPDRRRLAPKGFEDGYPALVPRSTSVRRGDVAIRVGALGDLVHSKELLRRAKDIEHLAQLYEQRPELVAGAESDQADLQAEIGSAGGPTSADL